MSIQYTSHRSLRNRAAFPPFPGRNLQISNIFRPQLCPDIFIYEEYDVQVTISCGITALKPADAKMDDLSKRADDNLYQSKRNGRDTITLEGEMQSKGGGKRMLATYTFFTQSMVAATQAEQPVGDELLLRVYDYNHEKCVVPPTFNVTVDTQIALMDAALKNSASKQVALNLTHRQFTSMHVADKLVEYKESTPELTGLIIELTQVPSVETMQKLAPIYHRAGIRIAIDDVDSDNHFEALKSLLPYIEGGEVRHAEPAQRPRHRQPGGAHALLGQVGGQIRD